MGLSQARFNSAVTNAAFHLRAAVEVRLIAEQVAAYDRAKEAGRYAVAPNHEVIAECGHRVKVIGAHDHHRLIQETAKIAAGKPRKYRCDECPREA